MPKFYRSLGGGGDFEWTFHQPLSIVFLNLLCLQNILSFMSFESFMSKKWKDKKDMKDTKHPKDNPNT